VSGAKREAGQPRYCLICDGHVATGVPWTAFGNGQPSSAAVTSPMWFSLLVPFGMLMEAAGPQGPDSGGGIMAAIILWGVVSLIFFIANAGLLISSVARGRSAMKPLIACALPIVCVVLPLVLEPFFVR
jgi:hypothetical protein